MKKRGRMKILLFVFLDAKSWCGFSKPALKNSVLHNSQSLPKENLRERPVAEALGLQDRPSFGE